MQQSRRHFATAIVFAALLPFSALAWDRGEVERFATLPAGNHHPEGITADRHGNVYVTTIDFERPEGLGRLFVFDRHGELVRAVDIMGSSRLLLDVRFNPITGELFVVDFGAAKVLKVNPHTGASRVFTTIPTVVAGPGLNDVAFDKHGNVYISDSFQGIIWRTGPAGGPPDKWAEDPLFKSTGVSPFGVNGLAFNKHGDTLFATNTGNNTIIKIPVNPDGTHDTPKVFVQGVNGVASLTIDEDDNLWIAVAQNDEIVVLDKTGRVIAKLGDFDGISRRGAPRGLLFPVSLARVGEWLYVTNLSFDLRFFGLPQAGDSQWAAQVTRHTVSRLKARIPPVRGLP